MKKNDFVMRFAGEGGQGVVTSAEGFAQAAAQEGYHIQTFATFPSQIMGGPTWTQTRISTNEVLSSGDELDVLVAFNEEAYMTHKDAVKKDGVIIFNSGDFNIDDDSSSIKALGIPFDELAKSTGNTRAANMVVMGALADLVNMPQSILESFVTNKFTRGRPNDAEIISSNIEALSLGKLEIEKNNFHLGELAPSTPPKYEQILINGNAAISVGALAAELDVFIGYPISPATPILLWMEQRLIGNGKFVHQSSSEIESIIAIIGAGYSGKKAMTSTAGPGFSLMSEGIGLAWMTEIPIVVVNVQRGGPATGLPTKTEQSDLYASIYPAHGDVSIPVIAPGTVEECFYASIKAINWAERYQGPVVLLSEHALAERQTNIPKPDIKKIKIENRLTYTGENGYKRYEGEKLSPMPIPGKPGSYVANGSEHDDWGDTTHLPQRHIEMTNRRFNKLKLLENEEYESINNHNEISIMPWGGSKGPVQEAYKNLIEEGVEIGWFYTMFLNPIPKKLLDELKEKKLIIVPELNYRGQWSSILRSYGINAKSITQYTGLPFKVNYLIEQIKKNINLE
ncbi:MAG: 2-oxoacid:acceptor oxidoreductase subunit alpha [SAR202 cluster bacterium]|nr:2-oxoacid:acceptor oxidoreductase subunit alpha [SAR202 cluster bacterium]